MKMGQLMELVSREPVFSSSLLLSGDVSLSQVRLQLSRWVNAGRVVQLRRGIYQLASPLRKIEAHPFLVANRMQHGSYVSMQSALGYYGIIPEYVPVVTSVGPGRPEKVHNPMGLFQYNHLSGSLLYGYTQVEVSPRQFAFVATPEKALLDLIYLTPGADFPDYLQELRLQNPQALDLSLIEKLARRSEKAKLIRAVKHLKPLLAGEAGVSL